MVFASYLARLSGTDADMPDLYVLKMAENSIVYAADPAGGDWTEYAAVSYTHLDVYKRQIRRDLLSAIVGYPQFFHRLLILLLVRRLAKADHFPVWFCGRRRQERAEI